MKRMNKRITTLILAGALGALAILAAVLATGGVANAASTARGGNPPGRGGDVDWGAIPVTQTAVISVVAGSPADKAGLKAGDFIVAIDGKAISTTLDLGNAVSARKPGDSLALDLVGADGAKRSVTVTLGDNPNKAGAAYLGITYGFPRHGMGMGDKDRRMNPGNGNSDKGMPGKGQRQDDWRGYPAVSAAGVMVTSVATDTPAAAAGIQARDVITAFNSAVITDVAGLKQELAKAKPGDKVTLTIARGNDTQTVTVTLGDNPAQKGSAYLGITAADLPAHGRMFRQPVTPKTAPAPSGTSG